MAQCELARTCLFFNDMLGAQPQTAALMKARYCKGPAFQDCGRYLVCAALGREAVPDDLAPNDRLRALAIIRDAAHQPTSGTR